MSLLGGSGLQRGADWDRQFPLACALYRMGAWSEAYRLFAGLEQTREDAALYCNIALCHTKAGQWERAVGYLEQALALLKKRPLEDRSTHDQTYAALAEKEYESESYLQPMVDTAPVVAPGFARTAIRCLLVDCCAELGQWDRVRTLASALKPGRYQNVDNALERVK